MQVMPLMEEEVHDFAAVIDPPFPGESRVLVTTSLPRQTDLIAYNVLRFVLVLVCAGLFLRTGASEQSISAIGYEAHHREQATKTRIILPQPAIELVAKSHVVSLDDETSSSATGGLDASRQRIAPSKRLRRTGTTGKAALTSPDKLLLFSRTADVPPPGWFCPTRACHLCACASPPGSGSACTREG